MLLTTFRFTFCLLIFYGLANICLAQQYTTVKGTITDEETDHLLPFVNVFVKGSAIFTSSDSAGNFSLEVPADVEIELGIQQISHEPWTLRRKFASGKVHNLQVKLKSAVTSLPSVQIEDQMARSSTLTRLDPRLINLLPSAGGIEALLKTLPGVSSNNELSSQYNVRGGNYDENLIYVNDIEIYRPFLIRSGQQEGLSFINSDMVSSILFSAGGFDARYGDKMSSVLDVMYRKPRAFGGTAQGSLLGGALTLEGASRDTRFTCIGGVRTRSNQYLLNTLDTKGDYKPFFADGQMLMHYDVSPELSFELLGNYARNLYNVVPETRKTDFGTVNDALRLTVYFEGQEVTDFETYMGAFSGILKPNDKLTLKFISSVFRSYEFETFDVLGQYYIDQLEADLSKPDFGDVKFNRGVGSFLNHARNYLTSTVANAEHKGYYKNMAWGLKLQQEIIDDKLKEWQNIDSAGYALPQTDPGELRLFNVVQQEINLQSQRISGYYQNHWSWKTGDSSAFRATAGIRGNYWTLNQQLLISPRATISWKPDWNKDYLFRFSSGLYSQPPFYRELRNLQGVVNTQVKAQQSIHFVLGSDHNFKFWNRPFKMVTELYYKQLDRLIPYEIDNVRIRYYARNMSKGYATGFDFKLNGDFVKGIESWFSVSVMQTKEDLTGDYYYLFYDADGNRVYNPQNTLTAVTDSMLITPGYIRRPTDQRVNVGIFFQDYVPRLPMCKMHLNLLFGSGLPFGPPSYERYKDTLKMPPYRRVDVGFSYQLIAEEKQLRKGNPFHFLKSAWLTLEVFNLLAINNTISYLWIRDITNREYAIPNYLTNRQVNAKLIIKF